MILQARDRGLFTAVTDCGAGGLSSAVGEMGEKIGAAVELDKVPLKYAGLRYDEIWISEAQERMVLSVPQEKLDELLELSAAEDVEATVIGTFGTDEPRTDPELPRAGSRPALDGLPAPRHPDAEAQGGGASNRRQRTSHRRPQRRADGETRPHRHLRSRTDFSRLLAHPNIASKHWIIRQYDHEVQGGSVIKPLIGPLQIGPSDAAVVRPKLASHRGVAIGCGLAPQIAGPLRDGARRDRRGGPQRGGGRGRPGQDRDPRQLLLAQRGRRSDDGHARPRLRGLPRRGPGLRHPLHQRQGQPAQPVHRQRNRPRSSASPTRC